MQPYVIMQGHWTHSINMTFNADNFEGYLYYKVHMVSLGVQIQIYKTHKNRCIGSFSQNR